jgi:hypothetical protein
MTFSYLRAYANTKKGNLLGSYIVSGSINAILLACLLVTPTPFLLNLQLVILVVEILVAFLLLIGSTSAGELIQKNIAKRQYANLIRFVQAYNFLQKYRWADLAYSLITFGLVVINMVSIGWVWQTVLFIFVYGVSAINTRTFISDLPQFVSTLDLQEEDFV